MSHQILENWPNDGDRIEFPDAFCQWANSFDDTLLPFGYSGEIYMAYKAWSAGREFGKLEAI